MHQSDDARFDLVFSFETLQFAGSLEALANEILGLLALSGRATAAFVQAAPDNELINLVNDVAKEFYPQSIRHDGALLRTLQTLLESAGFSVTYEPAEIYLNFEDINKKAMARTVTNYLTSAMFCPQNSNDRVKLEEALVGPLSEHFIDRPGKFAYRSVLLLAERP
ncbi:MAG TPA: hypothetical protein VGO47_01590 [Chlamydiales bacterium]|nr:hypothetical protein [Chlamydiales bacterium]